MTIHNRIKLIRLFLVKDLEHNKIVFINGKIERIDFNYETKIKLK